jgi:hypothetical protein
MLFKELIVINYDTGRQRMNTVCGQNEDILNVQVCGLGM